MFIKPVLAAPTPLTQDHLDAAGMEPTLAAKVVTAYGLLLQLFQRDQLVSVAWSGGKDSTVCLLLAVRAYHDAVARFGLTLPLVVTSADTGIENPVVHFHWMQMIAYLQAYAERHGLDIRFKVAKPTLISSWVVKIISGCGLPTFSNSKQRKCAIDLKREPANRC